MDTARNPPSPTKPLHPAFFSLLSALVGVVAGLGAVVFRGLIGLFHNLLFLGKWSTMYDANQHTPAGPWGPFVVLVPVVGAVGVAFLVKTFAPEAKGHGVPEVIDAIYYNRGRIRPVVALVKSVASALSIGSGGAVGREGPIIQIGSSFGSTLGQFLQMPAWQRVTLVAGGAGAGIAATFNTPVGGVLFALEMMMHEVSARTLVPVALATATGTYVGRLCFGPHPSFVIPALETLSFHAANPLTLLAFVGLGIIMGGAAALFIKSIYATEDFFEQRIKGSYYRQHLLGMFLVGLIIYGLMATTGHYYVEGVGYSTIQEILSSAPMPLLLLLALCALKLIATALTLGSGASGGIFSPALYLGATLGAAYGLILKDLFPGLGVSAPAFAVAGMAGIVGGATGAAMAAIVMIFEMTLAYNVIVPMTVTVAISYGVRKLLSPESIYTMKLARRGHFAPDALQASPHFVQRAEKIMQPKFGQIPASERLDEFVQLVKNEPSGPQIYLVMDEKDWIVGYIHREIALDARNKASAATRLSELANRNYIAVDGRATFTEMVGKFRASGARLAIVTNGQSANAAEKVIGVITKERLGEAAIEGAEFLTE